MQIIPTASIKAMTGVNMFGYFVIPYVFMMYASWTYCNNIASQVSKALIE